MMKNIIGILVLTIMWASQAQAVTYTVCSSGCDYTTISAAFSALDLIPDDVLEIRADTVGGSKTYSETIKPGIDDGGDSGHPVIVRSRSGDSITISGSAYGVDLRSNAVGYITIDGFTFTDPSSYTVFAGTSGNETDSTPTINGITIQNCTITGNTNQAIFFNKVNGGIIRNNVISTVSGDENVQSDAIDLYRGANTIVDGNVITINNGNNTNHIDGIQSDYEDNVTIINNKIIHSNSGTSNKQFIYLSDIDGYATIYNNILLKESGTTGSNMLSFNIGSANIGVYNNTLYATGANSGIMTNLTGSVDIQNNIVVVSGNVAGIWLSGGTQAKTGIHHNIVRTDSGGAQYYRDAGSWYDLSGWQTAGGGNGDINSLPTWDGNYCPVVGSIAIDHGVSESSVFSTDIMGISRPQGFAWDIGAYEFIQVAVTPIVVGNGSINPNTVQLVTRGSTTTFTVTPNPGYLIDLVTGCSGTLSGNTYTTGPILAACTVTATFAINSIANLPDCDLDGDSAVSVTDARRALGITMGLVSRTSDEIANDLLHGDVAPLVNGQPSPNGVIDLGDAVVILRKAVGLVSW